MSSSALPRYRVIAGVAAVLMAVSLAGCGDNGDDVGDAADDAAEETGEAVEEGGEAVEDATD